MKKSIVSFIVATLCMWSTSFAEDRLYSTEFQQCMEQQGGVTTDVMACGNKEMERLDAELNSLYKKIMSTLEKDIKEEKAYPNSFRLEELVQAKKALLSSQRLWIKYIESETWFVRNIFANGGGSEGRIMGYDRHLEILALRVKELRRYWNYVSPQQN